MQTCERLASLHVLLHALLQQALHQIASLSTRPAWSHRSYCACTLSVPFVVAIQRVVLQVHASTAATPDAPEIPSAIAHNSEQLLELSEEAKQLYATVSCLNDHIDRFRKGLGAAPDPFVDSSSSLQALRSELQGAASCEETASIQCLVCDIYVLLIDH